jgi:hypothetical protein
MMFLTVLYVVLKRWRGAQSLHLLLRPGQVFKVMGSRKAEGKKLMCGRWHAAVP